MNGNELSVFKSEQFEQVRTTQDENGKVLFCGSDVASALGYAKPYEAVSAHCRSTVKRGIPHPQSPSKTIDMIFIPEGDVYRLIARSKLPAAEQFESWIFDEVLPTIRKTGGYVANEDMFIDYYLPGADERTRTLLSTTLVTLRNVSEQLAEAKKQIETDKPHTEYGRSLDTPEAACKIEIFAKTLNNAGIPMGRNRLFEILREQSVLMRDNTPYQIFIDRGYFVIKERVVRTGRIQTLAPMTLITGRGQKWVFENFLRQNIESMA